MFALGADFLFQAALRLLPKTFSAFAAAISACASARAGKLNKRVFGKVLSTDKLEVKNVTKLVRHF